MWQAYWRGYDITAHITELFEFIITGDNHFILILISVRSEAKRLPTSNKFENIIQKVWHAKLRLKEESVPKRY